MGDSSNSMVMEAENVDPDTVLSMSQVALGMSTWMDLDPSGSGGSHIPRNTASFVGTKSILVPFLQLLSSG